jgi:hypothetical protein
MKMQKLKVVLLIFLVVSLCVSGNTAADDPSDSCPPLPEALAAMESDNNVTVKTVEVGEWEEGSNYYYAFEPKRADPKVGFIIYPGGLVDPKAYAPPAHAIAAAGYLTVIVKMKNDLAVSGYKKANEVISDYTGIEKWIIGGHSLGGVFSCKYAHEFSDKLDAVVLWASYPSENFRIDDKDLKAISIYGTKNLNIENFAASAEHLPPDTPFVIIEGGNHYQFGWYDASLCPEGMDRTPADITIEEQQEIIIQSTADFLKQFDPSSSTCTAEKIYGEYSEEAELLRKYRDEVLSKTPVGQEIIRLYYEWSPAIVKAMEEDEEFKSEVKELIDGILPVTDD